MALSPRQVALYGHVVNIWRQTETFSADGKPGALTWTLQASGVSCYADLGKSQMGPNGVLMVENDNLFTFDAFHFEDTVDVQVGDVLKITTGPELGFWTCRGNPQPKSRRANKLSILASRTPQAPYGVS